MPPSFIDVDFGFQLWDDALDESEQDENQHDQNQQAKASGRIVTPTGAVRPGWQRAYQQQDQNN